MPFKKARRTGRDEETSGKTPVREQRTQGKGKILIFNRL